MKLLTCLLLLLSLGTAVVAQPADEPEAAEKTPPSRSNALPAFPPMLEDESEAELSEVVYCARIRAFVFRMTEDKRLEYVGTTTCPRPIGGGLKKIDQQQQPAPALYAY